MTETSIWQCPVKTTSVLDLTPGALIGLNVGLAAGLLGAYLPDQTKYGPTWKRVLLIDLAAAAGAVGGAVAGCVANTVDCLKRDPSSSARAISAGSALAGGGLGILAGVLLTRHLDEEPQTPSTVASTLTLMPMFTATRGSLPGLSAAASF